MTNHVTAFDATAANAPGEHDPWLAREAVAREAASGRAPVRERLITYVGEVLVDFLPITEAGQTVGFRMHPGGSLLNAALATARLGQPAALAGKVATDFFGRYLHAYVESQGVDLRWLLPADAPSTLAFVAMESGDPAFAFYGEGAADSLLTIDEVPEALFAETRLLHVGSISLLRGTTPAAVLAVCERLKGKALLSLDPNVRPGLVRDEAAYRALLRRLTGLADIVKVSTADLAWLVPGQSAEDAARELLGRGPVLAVVTQGGGGVLALRARSGSPATLTVPAPAVEVVDTVGAGDAFTAGLLTRLAEDGIASRAAVAGVPDGWLTAALRFASAVAALNCTRPGADPPDRATVDAFLSGPRGRGDDR